MEQVQIHPQTAKALVALLTPSETAKVLGVKEDTLTVWRCQKRYDLPYVKVGRNVRYKAKDVAEFIERQTIAGQ